MSSWSTRRPWDQRRLGDFPLMVLANDCGAAVSTNEDCANLRGSGGPAGLSSRGRQVVVTSGDNVSENDAVLVVEEILALVHRRRHRVRPRPLLTRVRASRRSAYRLSPR